MVLEEEVIDCLLLRGFGWGIVGGVLVGFLELGNWNLLGVWGFCGICGVNESSGRKCYEAAGGGNSQPYFRAAV